MTAKEMREKRAALALQARGILDRAAAEKRDLSAEETTNWDAIHAEIDKLKGQIDRQERQEREELELRGSQGRIAGGHEGPPQDPGAGGEQRTAVEQAQQLHTEAFRNWLVDGMAGLSPEHRNAMASHRSDLPAEVRALSAGIDTAGGYTVGHSMAMAIETAQLAYAGLRNTRATILKTTTGNPMQMPTSNDTGNTGARLGENVAVGEQDLTVGSKTLRSYMYTSKLLRVSLQFLRDTSITDLEAWLAARLGERIGRITGTEFITGTGNNMPEGLAAATALGKLGTSTTSITYDDFVDLEHSIDPAYRRQSEWLMSDGLLKAAKKLKDGEGRPLWLPGMALKAPDTILNYKFTIDTSMPTPAASAKTAYFGDFSKFHIRDVSGMQMLRLTERYAEYLQVAFLLFSSHDSALLDAGTNPIKHFQQSA